MINCLNIQQQNTDMFVSSQQWKQNTVLIEGFIIKDLLLARHRLVLVVNKKAADKHFSSEFMMLNLLNCVYITTRCSPRLLCIKHWTLSQPLTSHILMWRLLFFSVSVQSCFSQLVFRFPPQFSHWRLLMNAEYERFWSGNVWTKQDQQVGRTSARPRCTGRRPTDPGWNGPAGEYSRPPTATHDTEILFKSTFL